MLASRKEVYRHIRKALRDTAFSPRAQVALSRMLRIKITTDTLRLEATDPRFFYLTSERKRQRMTWLLKAKGPIPIVTDTGKVIFRRATAKSLANGKWVYPGQKATDYLTTAMNSATKTIKDKVREDLRAQILAVFKKATRS